MKTGRKQFLAAAAALAFVVLPGLAVAKDKKETADTMITVYISAHGGSSIAKKANETHVKMEAAGWRFANMEVHTENADTEGAWLTYVK
jgi:predicted outer membrane protein